MTKNGKFEEETKRSEKETKYAKILWTNNGLNNLECQK